MLWHFDSLPHLPADRFSSTSALPMDDRMALKASRRAAGLKVSDGLRCFDRCVHITDSEPLTLRALTYSEKFDYDSRCDYATRPPIQHPVLRLKSYRPNRNALLERSDDVRPHNADIDDHHDLGLLQNRHSHRHHLHLQPVDAHRGPHCGDTDVFCHEKGHESHDRGAEARF